MVSAESGFFSWITNLKVIPNLRNVEIKKQKREETKPVETQKEPEVIATTTPETNLATSTASTTAGVIKQIVSAIKDDVSQAELAKLKTENETLKKTITNLQQKLANQSAPVNSCEVAVQKVRDSYTQENLARMKTLEWLVFGNINNNYRYKYDDMGNRTNERTLNSSYFRDGTDSTKFKANLKEYDDFFGTQTSLYYQKFLNSPSGDEMKRFTEFYEYFVKIRKFP